MNQEILNIDFEAIVEELQILSQRIINHNSVISNILDTITNAAEIDSDDMLFLNYEIGQLENVKKYLDEVTESELNTIIGIIGNILDGERMYANAFLNSDMLLEIRATYPEFNSSSADIDIEDIYKYKSLKIVIRDGEVETTLSDEDLKKMDGQFEILKNLEITVGLTQEEIENILDEIGLSQADKDKILAFTLRGIGADGLGKLKLGDIEITKVNGKFNITGTTEKISEFFGTEIKVVKPSEFVKGMMKKVWKDGKETWTFSGKGGVAKFNSLMTYLGLFNIVDDFASNYKISGDFQSVAFNGVMDLGLLGGGVYITSAVTGAVTGGLAITGGGIVVVAVLTGTVVTAVYNVVGTEVKEFVGGTLNDLFDTLRNLKYLVDDI